MTLSESLLDMPGTMTMDTMNDLRENEHDTRQPGDPMITGSHELSPSRQHAPVSVTMDSNDLRAHMAEPTYQTLNGRMSPPGGYHTGYPSLASFQGLPPIATVSDKFGQHQSIPVSSNGSFAFMPTNNNFVTMDSNQYQRYEKLAFGNGSPMGYSNVMMGGYGQVGYHPAYTNGLMSPKNDPKLISPNSHYGDYSRMNQMQSPSPMISNQMMHMPPSAPQQNLHMSTGNRAPERHDSKNEPMEELNTKELAQKISSELKRYSIPQAVFAQRVLCRSQGTLSDLLRNPKPWSKLKSGRETFRRMWKWLQEPEFSRMQALRLADVIPMSHMNPVMASQSLAGVAPTMLYSTGQHEPLAAHQPLPAYHAQPDTGSQMIHLQDPKLKGTGGKRKIDNDMMSHSSDETRSGPKKPRLVFTDIQRRTLHAIFKETKRPSKEMQTTIAQQLGLEVTTVNNFFMNARRRSVDKYKEEMDRDSSGGSTASNRN